MGNSATITLLLRLYVGSPPRHSHHPLNAKSSNDAGKGVSNCLKSAYYWPSLSGRCDFWINLKRPLTRIRRQPTPPAKGRNLSSYTTPTRGSEGHTGRPIYAHTRRGQTSVTKGRCFMEKNAPPPHQLCINNRSPTRHAHSSIVWEVWCKKSLAEAARDVGDASLPLSSNGPAHFFPPLPPGCARTAAPPPRCVRDQCALCRLGGGV